VGQPEIKRAYKQLALKFHPDVSPPDKTEEYTEKFIRVQEAYETLSDPKTRVLYDMDMSKGLHLAFNIRKGDRNGERSSEWMNQWQSQIVELNRRSKVKNSRGSSESWGDRMRRERSESC
jgi:DnaJ-class molecular chaperone